MANNYSRQTPKCSFCGKDQHAVRRLVAGPNVYICDECIRLCNDILHDEDFATPEQDVYEPKKKTFCLFCFQKIFIISIKQTN